MMEKTEVKIIFSTVDIDDSGVRLPERHEFAGVYSENDSWHYISYKAVDEDGRISSVLVKFADDGLTYRVSGASSSEMIFKKGKSTRCDYKTPYGSIPMVVSTASYSMKILKNDIELKVNYSLKTGSTVMTKREMQIIIKFN